VPSARRVVVVGASLAGLRTAEQLRAAGHAGELLVLGAEQHPPYNRPPLSKEVLADQQPADPAALAQRLAFRQRSSISDVTFLLGETVTTADLAAGTLSTASGRTLTYGGLVAATGLRPRRLAVPGPLLGRHVLRTVDDCHALRSGLARESRRVVVVGAGFIGCEVAGALSALGHTVTVVEPAGAPMARVLGHDLAEAVQRHHERAGIRFVLGTGVSAFTGLGHVTGVLLDDGQEHPADVVVEAVGSTCNTEWLDGNGLDLTDGVLVDEHLLATAPTPLVAVGDIARFPNPLFDREPRRVEHWSIPTDTARRAAVTLARALHGSELDPMPFAPVPSFWSDQLDLRFQSFGSPALADRAVVEEGDLDHLTDGVLVTYHRGASPVGTVALNLSPARQRDLRSAFTALVPTA
jgi:3-phenylpropionate/trans-cinnamate dioxygenase ferredoxin reductase component